VSEIAEGEGKTAPVVEERVDRALGQAFSPDGKLGKKPIQKPVGASAALRTRRAGLTPRRPVGSSVPARVPSRPDGHPNGSLTSTDRRARLPLRRHPWPWSARDE